MNTNDILELLANIDDNGNTVSKRCCTCKTEKAHSEYSRNRSKKDGLQNRCKGCEKANDSARLESARTFIAAAANEGETAKDTAIRLYADGSNHDLFWAKVDKTEACWTWKAASNKDGYGIFAVTVNGGTVTVAAHRLAYALVNGADQLPKSSKTQTADSMTLDHTCENPLCVNPAHLEPVTNAVNSARKVSTVRTHARIQAAINAVMADLPPRRVDMAIVKAAVIRNHNMAA